MIVLPSTCMPNPGAFPPRLARSRRRRLCRSRQQHIQQPLLGVHLGPILNLFELLLAHHVDGDFHQVAHDGVDIAPHIPNLGELRSLNLQEGRVRQLRQAPRNLGLAHARRPDHDDVLGHDLVGEIGRQFLPPHAVAQRNRHGALGRLLPHDVLVQLRHNLARRQLFQRQLLVFRRSR